MATVYVEFGSAASPAISQGLHHAAPVASEKLAVSGTAAVSAAAPGGMTVNGQDQNIARVTTDVDVWLTSGTGTPNPSNAPRRVLLAGSSIDLLVPAGHKIAVKALD
ncbi:MULTISPECIES: hypothetical protein [unclassified Chelatococcus]|nr:MULTISPECIES: hypothetical protein [unclassified Chelatococcus]MBS7737948.1 hypothetical protein [Chelatococcus sp. HY11]MBS7741431.1 hypothetical protein [Chelatococcus sp. HY11]MCO5077266.1 hypothetical protein [Chelatococcus sp.]